MGLTFRGTDIQTANIFLDIVSGYFEPASVRGKDVLIPGKEGMHGAVRERSKRLVRLEGWVQGTGATVAAQQASWHTSMLALMVLMDRTAAAGNLVVTSPYMGLSAGTKTLSVKCINQVGGDILAAMTLQRWSFDLECIADPPEWVAS